MEKFRKKNNLNPNYIVGFTDAEGSFYISIYKNIWTNNYKVSCEMHITQNIHSIKILEKIRDYFKCGIIKVDNKLTNTMRYQINSYKDIADIIIPFFDKYPLLTSKYLNYQTFKEAIHLMINKEHLNDSGILKFIELKKMMNRKRSFFEKYNFCKKHLNKYLINKDWFLGFVDGEGCFYFYIGKQKNTTIQLQASLEIAQNTHDIFVLEAIRKFLGCGRLKPKTTEFNLENVKNISKISRLIISNPSDLKKYIIPFFNNNILLTTKNLDFTDWKNLIGMKEKKYHLSLEGLNLMRSIKSNMNTSRNNY
ncbi:hypothetical protein BB561_000014 [Smittium simulii]|uniref:Homing endonuclease LAGLIDADG domain-containing protein n=1 Tax=Smittium simulii TaxID=133385 RepID=A0A2T9Z116_9FUNG|nr:hypothetical protein BB561_000038 [Smittium simulii]PVU98267.1 hypothetical protein BB561_000014 [Smittium simulii]